jgi:hypothetical protein
LCDIFKSLILSSWLEGPGGAVKTKASATLRLPPGFSAADIARAVDENYGVLRHHFSALVVEHLIDCLHAFGDLEEMLVLEFLKDLFLRTHVNAAVEPGRLSQDFDGAATASLIAAKTGIPRQTVRRKLLSLERRGWVTQTDDAAWRIKMRRGEAAVSSDIAPLDKRGVERLVRLLYTVQPYVSELRAPPTKQGKATDS